MIINYLENYTLKTLQYSLTIVIKCFKIRAVII